MKTEELYFSLKEINIMKHTVGLDNNPKQKGEFYRNRYIIKGCGDPFDSIIRLTNLGMMKAGEITNDNDIVFYLTEKGLETVRKF